MINHNLGKIIDIPFMRTQLPSINTFKMKASVFFSIVKDLIGKDITKIALPVFMNEPTCVIQRLGEFMSYISRGLILAAKEEDPCKQLALVASNNLCAYNCIIGRFSKSFNPLLGETFEMVTPEFRLLVETVSHHPPISAVHLQVEGAEFASCK